MATYVGLRFESTTDYGDGTGFLQFQTFDVTTTININSSNIDFEPIGNGGIGFSPDGAWLALGSDSNPTAPYLFIYDTATWTLQPALVAPPVSAIYAAKFSPSGDYLAVGEIETGDSTGRVYIYDTSDWSLLASVDLPAGMPYGPGSSLAWMPDDSKVWAASFGGTKIISIRSSDWTILDTITLGSACRSKITVSLTGDTLSVGLHSSPYAAFYDTSALTDRGVGAVSLFSAVTGTAFDEAGDFIYLNSSSFTEGVQVFATPDPDDPSTWTLETMDSTINSAQASTAVPRVGAFAPHEEALAVSLWGTGGVRFGYLRKTAGTWTMTTPTSGSFTHDESALTRDIGFFTDGGGGGITDDLEETSEVTDTVDAFVGIENTDGVVASTTLDGLVHVNHFDGIVAGDSPDNIANLHVDATDLAQLTDQLTLAFYDLLTAAVTNTATVDLLTSFIEELVDRVIAAGPVDSMLTAYDTLVDAFVAADVSAYFNDTDVTEEVIAAATLDSYLQARELVAEAFVAAGIVDLLNSVFVLVSDNVALTATPDSQASLNELLTEVFQVGVVVDIAGESYTVLAVNLGSSAVTRYTNYAFNSMARIGQLYVGAAEDGLYSLDGDDDDGVPIYAGMKTGTLDFGIADLKRVLNAYVGLTRSGRLVMKVTTTQRKEGDQPVERWYAMKQNTAGGQVVGGRFELGRGIKSRYWQFELVNIDGDDFELDGIDLDLVKLSRRS